jgi:hypothetical protein
MAARKRVTPTWSKRNEVVDRQGWRTLADCLGYHTPYLQTPTELGARVVRNFNYEENECPSSTTA